MDRGGMETLIMNIYRTVDRTKVQFDFAVHGNRNGDYESEIYELGGRFYRFPAMRKNPVAYRNAWRRFWQVHSNEFTVFHFHTNSLANIIAFKEAYEAGVMVRLVHSHSSSANKGKLQILNNYLHKLHQKKIAEMATSLIACSDEAADWLYGGKRIGRHTVTILKNGVDVKQFAFNQETRNVLRKQLGLKGKKVIGHVGSFIAVKNHEFLLDIIDKAYKIDNRISAILVGSGELKEQIMIIAKERHLENVIQFLGVRGDISNLLSAMDLFILPSVYEGLPVSLVEVQANGLPALVSDTVTKNIKVNDNIEYLSLNKGTTYWAERAVTLLNTQKHSFNTKPIVDSGFDIRDTVDIYVSILQSSVRMMK
jgi:glycosyltransferase involved in cell wall biosynthesis